MPLYEYQCRACQKTAEVRHGFKETFDGTCEACGGEMARVYSAAGIVFKGSGFYLTDSRKAAEAAKSGSKPAATESAAAPAATSEGAPAAGTPAVAPAAATPAAPAAAPAKSESAA